VPVKLTLPSKGGVALKGGDAGGGCSRMVRGQLESVAQGTACAAPGGDRQSRPCRWKPRRSGAGFCPCPGGRGHGHTAWSDVSGGPVRRNSQGVRTGMLLAGMLVKGRGGKENMQQQERVGWGGHRSLGVGGRTAGAAAAGGGGGACCTGGGAGASRRGTTWRGAGWAGAGK
jgi:hypothetical protein